MTERLYYNDSYLRGFRARVVDQSDAGRVVYLDRTAFYPASGGQPHDLGTLGGVEVVEVIDEGEAIAHRLAAPLSAIEVEGHVDWTRRFDHMQQHSGQHLLSAVLEELYKLKTISFHLGADASTIDLETSDLTPDRLMAAERRANEIVFENLPLSVSFEDAASASGLRKPSERAGELRIVSIGDFDRSACGGTHVRATGEIGPLLIRRAEKIRGCVRIEFLCGRRAVSRARSDFDALSGIARLFSSQLDEAAARVAAQMEQLKEAEKARRALAVEKARWTGRSLYDCAAPDAGGRRRHFDRRTSGAIDDELRAMAQSYTAQPAAVFVVAIEDPPTVLLAASPDAGVHAGNVLKGLLTANGGRGGGNAQLAQGSLPAVEALNAVVSALTAE